jgi:hypothetical protein
MRTIEWIVGAVLVVAIINVLVNSQNNTSQVIGAVGTNSNSILQTLVRPGG